MTASKRQVGGSHYRDLQIQPSYFCHINKLGWLESNAIKYVCRHAAKHGRQDIEKAIHYLQLLLEWEYGEAAPPADDRALAVDPNTDSPADVSVHRDLSGDPKE